MVRHIEDIRSVEMKGQGVKGVTKRIAIGPKDGYEGYIRVFTVQPGGFSPYHSHPWFHANYILEGSGAIIIEGIEHPVKKGSIAYIEGGKKHHFVNQGAAPLVFICLVPPEGDSY